MDNPICPACYGDTSTVPVEGLKYYKCKICKHIFADTSNSKAKRFIKRCIFRSIDNQTGLFDPFANFNGSKDTINRVVYGLPNVKGVVISNFDHDIHNFTSKQCILNAEDDFFKKILESHSEVVRGNFLSLCFMPFCDDIHEFLTACYRQKGKDGHLIVLTNIDDNFLHNNIGQVHHFSSSSLHYILSSQQKDYDVFTIDNVLGFKIY